ncbi:MAG: hypothetical protein ACR2OE_04905, partial [Thermomicrobiales bacterium]
LKGSVETLAIRFGSTFLPAIRAVVDGITAFVNLMLTLPQPVLAVLGAITGLVGVLALGGGAFLLIAVQVAKFKAALDVLKGAQLGEAMFASLGAAIPIILAVVAAAALLYLAYRTNFLGIGTLIDGFISGIRNFVSNVSDAFHALSDPIVKTQIAFGSLVITVQRGGQAMSPVVAIFHAIATALREIGGGNIGIFNTLANGFDALGKGVQGALTFVDRFRQVFNDLVNPLVTTTVMFGDLAVPVQKVGQGVSVVTAFFIALSTALRGIGGGIPFFIALANAVDVVGLVVQTFTSTFDRLVQVMNPVSAALSSVAQVLVTLAGVFPGLTSVLFPLSGVFTELSAAVRQFGTAIGAAFSGDFRGALSSLEAGLSSVRSAFADLQVAAEAASGLAIAALGRLATFLTTALFGAFGSLGGILTTAGAAFGVFASTVSGIPVIGGALAVILNTIGNVASDVGGKLTTLAAVFTLARTIGMDPMQAALSALTVAFPALSGVTSALSSEYVALAGVVTNLVAAFNQLLSGNFSGAFDSLKRAGTDLLAALSRVGDGLIAIGALIFQGLQLAFAAIPWATLGGILLAGMRSALGVLSTIGGFIGGLLRSLGGEIARAFGSIDFRGIGSAIDRSLRSALNSINFRGAGQALGTKVRDAFSAIDWGAVAQVILIGLLAIPAAIGYLGSLLIPKAIEFINGFITGLGTSWGRIGSAIRSGLARAVSGAGDALKGLEGIFASALDGMAARVPGLANVFTGLADTVRGFGKVVEGIFHALGAVIDGDFTGVLIGLGTVLSGLGQIVIGLASTILGALGAAASGLRSGLNSALDDLAAKFPGLATTIGQVKVVLDSFLGVIQGLSNAFSALLQNDIGGFFSGIGAAAVSSFGLIGGAWRILIGLLIDGLKAIPWSDLFSGIGDALNSIPGKLQALSGYLLDAIQSAAGAVDWSALVSGARDIVGNIIGKLGNLADAVGNWIASAAESIDWSALWSGWNNAAGTLGSLINSGIQTALSTIGDGITIAWDWLTNKVGEIDWSAALAAIKQTGTDLLNGLKDGAVAGWTAVTGWVSGVASTVATWFIGQIPALLATGTAILNGLKDGLVAGWAAVTGWVSGVASTVATWFMGQIPALLATGTAILNGLKDGLVAGWTAV